MFDIAWSEMLVIGAVALVVIGPKDLPKALRSVGEMVGKVKRMAAEFQGQFSDAMREAELHDLKKQVEDVGGSVQAATKVDFNPIQTIREEIKGVSTASAASTAPLVLATDASAQPVVQQAEPFVALPEPPPPFNPAELAAPAGGPAAEAAATPAPDMAPKVASGAKAAGDAA
jgi:sec-independent protein translocase protein TatB